VYTRAHKRTIEHQVLRKRKDGVSPMAPSSPHVVGEEAQP
jgi:hypothetical protein